MVFCTCCGKEIHETAPVCPYCGGIQPCSALKTVSTGVLTTGVLTGSYLCAVFVPLVGIIMAIVIAVKGNWGHFMGVICLSIITLDFWIVVWIAVWKAVLSI